MEDKHTFYNGMGNSDKRGLDVDKKLSIGPEKLSSEANDAYQESIISNLVLEIDKRIRKVFPEKRLVAVVTLTKQQIETVLHNALANGFTLEEARVLSNKLIAESPTKGVQDESIFDISERETSKFTTRSFGMNQRRFIKSMIDRIEEVFIKLGILGDHQDISKDQIVEQRLELRRFVSENIRSRLQMMEKALHFNKFIGDTDEVANQSTPEEMYEEIEAYENTRVQTLEQTYMMTLQKWADVFSLEDEREKIGAVLIEAKRQLLSRLRKYPTPYYLFQAVPVLVKDAHRNFLEVYESFPEERWTEDEEMVRKIAIPENIRKVLLGQETLDEPYRVRYIHTLADFETAMEDYGIQHGEVYEEEGLNDLRILFDKAMSKAYADLLHTLGVLSDDEFAHKERRKHILDTFDNAVQRAVEKLQNEKKNIERECIAMGVTIPKDELNIDIHNRAKVTTLLELLHVVIDDSYPVQDRFGAQIAAIDAFYYGVLERSSFYKEAEEIRRMLPKGEVGRLSQRKVLKRSGLKSIDGYEWEYYDLVDKESLSVVEQEQEGYTVVLQEDLPVRFWHPEGKLEEEDAEGGVYFTSPTTPQTKSVESTIMKLVVPNDINRVVDIFDMNRDAFNLCYSTEEIKESIRAKEADPENGGKMHLIDRIYLFMNYIATKRMGWKTQIVQSKKLTAQQGKLADQRAQLTSGQYMVENKLEGNTNKKSSSLFGALKLYGRTKQVGMEVQFRTLDTILAESTETGSHGFYEINRWNEVGLEKYAKSIYPGVSKSLNELLTKRREYQKEVEDRIRKHHEQILKARKESATQKKASE